MPARLEFELPLGKPAASRRAARAHEPMRLLLLGDFGGAATGPALAERTPYRVDVDSLDSVMRRVAPRITLQVDAQACEFAPTSLDDFHPDHLLAALQPLAQQADRLARLKSPATFAQAAAEMGLLPAGIAQSEGPAPAAPAASDNVGDLLSSLLGGKVKSAAAPAAAPSTPAAQGIDALLRGIVQPHVVKDAPAHQAPYVDAAQAQLGEQLRAVLHDPAFQSLEAAGRGVQWRVSTLELDESLQLHLLDMRVDEFTADLVAAQGRVVQLALHATLVDRVRNQPGAVPWAACVCLFNCGASAGDLATLTALGLLGAEAGAPVLAGVQPALMGLVSFADAASQSVTPMPGWQPLRQSEAAAWISATAPRMLMRLPYGKRLEPVQAFAFEEFNTPAPLHEHLLWAPGSLAVAQVLGRAFMDDGWAGDPTQHNDVGDLPAYAYERDGERHLQACAEFHLGEAAALALAEQGLTVLLSHRQQAELRLLRLQSMASPPTALAGPWG